MTTDKPSIYDQHRAAFANVSAFVVLKDGERVATIAFRFPRDGAGRLYAYVHWVGTEMARGWASGYGYDKRSAACASAAERMKAPIDHNHPAEAPKPADHPEMVAWTRFRDALKADDGREFDRRLRETGFTVFQAV